MKAMHWSYNKNESHTMFTYIYCMHYNTVHNIYFQAKLSKVVNFNMNIAWNIIWTIFLNILNFNIMDSWNEIIHICCKTTDIRIKC